jgi:hypothetical protein
MHFGPPGHPLTPWGRKSPFHIGLGILAEVFDRLRRILEENKLCMAEWSLI